MYTPVNPSFTIYKWGLSGSILYRHVFVMRLTAGTYKHPIKDDKQITAGKNKHLIKDYHAAIYD